MSEVKQVSGLTDDVIVPHDSKVGIPDAKNFYYQTNELEGLHGEVFIDLNGRLSLRGKGTNSPEGGYCDEAVAKAKELQAGTYSCDEFDLCGDDVNNHWWELELKIVNNQVVRVKGYNDILYGADPTPRAWATFNSRAEAEAVITAEWNRHNGPYIDIEKIDDDNPEVKIDGWISSTALEAIVYLLRGGVKAMPPLAGHDHGGNIRVNPEWLVWYKEMTGCDDNEATYQGSTAIGSVLNAQSVFDQVQELKEKKKNGG